MPRETGGGRLIPIQAMIELTLSLISLYALHTFNLPVGKTMIDLENMSLDDLKKLSRDVEKAIASFEERKRKEARKAMEKVARDFGLSVEEVIGVQKSPSRSSKSAAKYRNPANPSDTWSGRGRQPGWYKDAIAKGKSPDSMLA
jgi:DNA-binding protein H-NS